jgi:hypothetical protein
MDRNLIIDADHFSMLALDALLGMAEERDYPLISGHSFLHHRATQPAVRRQFDP